MHFWSPQTVGKIVLASALFLVPSLALAAPATSTQPVATSSPQATASSTMIADVNISNAALLYQNGRKFQITFTIQNGVGAQNGIRYSVGLQPVASGTPVFIAQQVASSTYALPAHSQKQVSTTYTAPSSVSGNFYLLVESYNTQGLPLGSAFVSKVSIPPSNGVSGIYINPGICFLTINASTTRYALLQGVDIQPSDTLNLHCLVHNVSKTPWVVTPAYTTYYRTLYGQQVPQQGGDTHPFSIKGDATTTVSLALPKATTPQSYDVAVSFMSQGKTVSNTFPVHYVIDGPSATIQTLSLDQTAYKKGDTAIASFVWTPSADGFPGARISSPSPSATTYTLSLTNGAGTSCIASSTDHGTLPQNPQGSITKLSLPIVVQCTNPHLSLSLVDASSTILAARSFTASSSATVGGTTSAWYVVLLAVAILAIILLIIALMRRYGFAHTSATFPLLLVALCVAGFMTTPGQAHAATFVTSGYIQTEYSGFAYVGDLYVYTVNTNQSTYQTGQNVNIQAQIQTTMCGNQMYGAKQFLYQQDGSAGAQIDQASLSVYSPWNNYTRQLLSGSPYAAGSYGGTWDSYGKPLNTYGYGGINIPGSSNPGTYNLTFTGKGWYTYAVQSCGQSCNNEFGWVCTTVCSYPNPYHTYHQASINIPVTFVSPIPSCPSGQYYNTTLRSCVSNNYGHSCTSGANVCSDTSTGTYGPNGVCMATIPSNTLCTCQTQPNACNMKSTGHKNAAGTSCVGNPPPNSACCTAGNFWNTAINACSPQCGANATLNNSSNTCACNSGGFQPVPGTNSCACPQFTSKVGSVCQDNAPSVSFSASPTQVYRGGSSKVTWSTDPAVTPVAQTSCGLAPGSTGGGTGFNPAGRPNGTYNLNNLTATTSLSIVCSYKGQQSPPKNVMIKVLQPNMTLTTTPDKVNSSGGTSSVSWSANNVTSCSLTKNGQNWAPSGAVLTPPKGSHAISGSASVTVTSNTTVTLTCNGSSVTKTIDVAGKYFNF